MITRDVLGTGAYSGLGSARRISIDSLSDTQKSLEKRLNEILSGEVTITPEYYTDPIDYNCINYYTIKFLTGNVVRSIKIDTLSYVTVNESKTKVDNNILRTVERLHKKQKTSVHDITIGKMLDYLK